MDNIVENPTFNDVAIKYGSMYKIFIDLNYKEDDSDDEDDEETDLLDKIITGKIIAIGIFPFTTGKDRVLWIALEEVTVEYIFKNGKNEKLTTKKMPLKFGKNIRKIEKYFQ